jgi:hypothetical protein
MNITSTAAYTSVVLFRCSGAGDVLDLVIVGGLKDSA